MKPNLWLWAAVIVLLAGALRVPGLDQRPMHADEAILADKFGTLLESGSYEYDPTDYHGPMLGYLSTVPAWLTDRVTYRNLTESTLRVVPALAGTILALTPLLLVGVLGRTSAVAAGLILAASSACVYYSRFYIPETLLALFTAGFVISLYRVSLNRSVAAWAAAGVSAAWMLATKETAVIAFAAALPFAWTVRVRPRWSFLTAFALMLTLCVNPIKLAQSFVSYTERGLGPSLHVQAPWYFLVLIASDPVILLAVPGFFLPRTDGFARFLRWFAFLLLVIYSAIPYKTPWLVVNMMFALALLVVVPAGIKWIVPVFATVLIAAVGLAAQRSMLHPVDPSNPWVYAHTSPDVFRIRDALLRFGNNVAISVYADENLWPLPWYLRHHTNVKWSRRVVQEGMPTPIVVSTSAFEADLLKKFYEAPPPGQRELYMNLFRDTVYLRPGVEVRGFARKSLMDSVE